ncbi:hypothetical protein PtA15_2A245 [Puccinia triticina]|uniref:Uncharacterized protein n=1 Tax=Puccinia triticina TaxID=208348 RepID=A0ABY7CDD4_9BASI|nr:uncharacterized protein PtA15_2A245 [Puccinia triticina]WAQ81932.1 hypothetical protein PtA15_2A245 [Puccinia triticina]
MESPRHLVSRHKPSMKHTPDPRGKQPPSYLCRILKTSQTSGASRTSGRLPPFSNPTSRQPYISLALHLASLTPRQPYTLPALQLATLTTCYPYNLLPLQLATLTTRYPYNSLPFPCTTLIAPTSLAPTSLAPTSLAPLHLVPTSLVPLHLPCYPYTTYLAPRYRLPPTSQRSLKPKSKVPKYTVCPLPITAC